MIEALGGAETEVDAGSAVAFYPTRVDEDALERLSCPTMVIIGEDDVMIPSTFLDSLKERCPQPSKGRSFEGCGHAFAHR